MVAQRGEVREVHENFKKGAVFMRQISIVSNTFIFVYFMGYTICYHTSFVIYLPPFLSLSVLFGSLNFGQTRKFYNDIWQQLCFYGYICCAKKRSHSNSKESNTTQKQSSHSSNTVSKNSSHSASIPKVLQLIGVSSAKQITNNCPTIDIGSSKSNTTSDIAAKLKESMKGSKSLRGNKPETLLSLNFKEPNSSPILQRKHRKSPAKHRKASKGESLGLLQCAGVTIFEPITKSKSMILFNKDHNLGLPGLPDTHSLGDTHRPLSLNSINISQATPTIDTSTRQSPKRVSIYEHNNETVMFDNNFVTLDDYNPFDNKTDDLSDTERIILTPHDTNTHETDTNEDQSRLLSIYNLYPQIHRY